MFSLIFTAVSWLLAGLAAIVLLIVGFFSQLALSIDAYWDTWEENPFVPWTGDYLRPWWFIKPLGLVLVSVAALLVWWYFFNFNQITILIAGFLLGNIIGFRVSYLPITTKAEREKEFSLPRLD